MTNKERLYAVLHGQTPDRVPFAPFAELIPSTCFELKYREKGMGRIVHCDSICEQSTAKKYIRIDEKGKRIYYHTSLGELTELFEYKKGGSNDGWVQAEYLIKQVEDYPKAIEYINSIDFYLDEETESYSEYCLGDEGLLHLWTFEPPFMAAQYYLGLEKWTYDRIDYPDEFNSLLIALKKMQERRLTVALQSKHQVFNLANLAGNFSPKDFETYMIPYISKYAELFKQSGKLTTIHADASNLSQFKELIPQCNVPIIEAFTPPPVGDLSIADARKAWGEGITIWVNMPEAVFYNGYEATKNFTKELLLSDQSPNKIIGMTEMGFIGCNTANVELFSNGVMAILDACMEYGGY